MKTNCLIDIEKLEDSFISFDLSARSIKLRGPSDIASKTKTQLEMMLNGIRKAPSMIDQPATLLKCSHSAPSVDSSNNSRVSNKIFVMRKEEDSAVLMTWLKQILPFLPNILTRYIGPNYSASLVRQGLSSASAQAVIRIQCPFKASKDAQSCIRRQVKGLGAGNIRLQFSESFLTLLAGSSSHISLEDSEEQENANGEANCCKFPHWKRLWPRPGMSASIGMRCTRKVSATSCCYVNIDDDRFLLTVNHFIQDSLGKRDNDAGDKLSLTSPALLDIDEMMNYYEQILRDIEIGMEEALRLRFGDTLPGDIEIPLEVIELTEKSYYVQGLVEQLSKWKDTDDIILASVVHQNKLENRVSTTQTAALWSELGNANYEIRHRMDWALCSVSKRAGINRTRYRFDLEQEKVDFFDGDIDQFGAGEPCQGTCNVEPNTEVYFVGQTSGRRRAQINAAPILISRDGKATVEWSLIVAPEEQKEDKEWAGDSGAGIMRTADNSLVGLLWGCHENQLLFTPIIDVFMDIKEQTRSTNVYLSQIWTDPAPSPIPISLSTIREPILICRDLTTESPSKRCAKSSDLQLPSIPRRGLVKKPALSISYRDRLLADSNLCSLGKVGAVSDQGFPFQDGSLSPVPSLSSPSSVSSKSVSILSILDQPSPDEVRPKLVTPGRNPGIKTHLPTIVIREDSEAPEVLVTNNVLPPPKFEPLLLRIQELSARFQGAITDKENKMSLKNLLINKPDPKFAGAKKTSFSGLERSIEQRRPGTWPVTQFR